MNPSSRQLLVASVFSPLAAVVVAFLGNEASRRQHNLALAPFGRSDVLIVHLLAALPFSVLAARGIYTRFYRGQSGWRGAWLAGALILSVLLAGLGDFSAGSLAQAPFLPRVLARTSWCLLLMVPWCLAFLPLPPASTPSRLDLGIALALGFVLPGAYAVRVATGETAKLSRCLERKQLIQARAALQVIRELGTGEQILGVEQEALAEQLEKEITATRKFVEQHIPEAAPTLRQVERAERLATVDRLEEAVRILRPLAAKNGPAKLSLATVLQEKEEWEESNAFYREVLEHLLPSASGSPQTLARCLICYDGLAFNARAAHEYAKAEVHYLEALERLPPGTAPHIVFRLGMHYLQAGRPGAAIERLREAVRLDPSTYRDRAQPIIDHLRLSTPACILNRESTR